MLCETWNWDNHYSYSMTEWTAQEQRHFHLLHADQLNPATNSLTSNDTRESLVNKQPWSKAEYLFPSCAKSKILWSCNSIPLHAFNADMRKGTFITNEKGITLHMEKSHTDCFNKQMSKETNM